MSQSHGREHSECQRGKVLVLSDLLLLCELEDFSERVERVLSPNRIPLEVADVIVRRKHDLHRADMLTGGGASALVSA